MQDFAQARMHFLLALQSTPVGKRTTKKWPVETNCSQTTLGIRSFTVK